MKIIFDNDATVTEYEEFIDRYAVPFFKRRYGLDVVNPNALELEDIFELKTDSDKMLDSFWVSFRFVQYTLLSRFRPGAAAAIRHFRREGHQVEIHTSRLKTCEGNLVGALARLFTIWQYWLNGVFLPPSHFFFYPDDTEKTAGVMKANPAFVFEDKPCLIKALAEKNVNVFGVRGRHNRDMVPEPHIEFLETYEEKQITQKMEALLGKSALECCNRGAKADRFYRRLFCLQPVIYVLFRPIILHREKIVRRDGRMIYASNHRSTLDPLVITAILKECIHWGALKRFFLAEDSIFNNSKNRLLCKFTAWLFHKLVFFPIERKRDNPKANNFPSIRDMITLLQSGHRIGIFPEGTTRRPDGQEFGDFDDFFIGLAKKTGACIQPISVIWFKDWAGKRMCINFGETISVREKEKNEVMKEFMAIQRELLLESKENLNAMRKDTL